jgi:hypothetical protein
MSQAHMGKGARLSFVVVPQEGTVQRPVQVWKKGSGITEKYIEQPAGYLVYFPRGHVVRIADKKALQHYGLDKEAQIVNLQGLNDPNSPLGKIMMAQDEGSRARAFADLQKQVMQMAQAGSGKIELVRDPRELEEAA